MGTKVFKAISNEEAEDYSKKLNVPVEQIREIEKHYKFVYKFEGEPNKKNFMQKFKNNFQTKDIWKDEYNEFTSQVFDLFDVDGNGVLSFEEFLVGNIMLSCQDPTQSLHGIFKVLDVDKDGFISQKEALHIFTAARPLFEIPGTSTPEQDTAALMAKLDPQNAGKVSKEAFLNALVSDPDFSKYFKKLKLTIGSIGNRYLEEPGYFDNKKKFDIL